MPKSSLTADILVAGAGPAGCTAALYAARAKLKTVMSSPTELAGNMARAPWVANFPGQIEVVPGRAILSRIRTQALTAGAEHIIEKIYGVDFSDPEELVIYGGAREHHVRALIVATGATGRASKTPGEEEFTGRGVAYCVACDGPFFTGERVLVVGQDEQAADEALTLSDIASEVHLVLAGQEPDLDPEVEQEINRKPNMTIHTGLQLSRIVGEQNVTGAIFRDTEGEEQELEAAGVFLYIKGNRPSTEFLGDMLQADADGFLITDEICQTSRPGVFAAGDVRSKQVRQMVIAAGEGATAALAAERYVRKAARVRWDRGE